MSSSTSKTSNIRQIYLSALCIVRKKSNSVKLQKTTKKEKNVCEYCVDTMFNVYTWLVYTVTTSQSLKTSAKHNECCWFRLRHIFNYSRHRSDDISISLLFIAFDVSSSSSVRWNTVSVSNSLKLISHICMYWAIEQWAHNPNELFMYWQLYNFIFFLYLCNWFHDRLVVSRWYVAMNHKRLLTKIELM